MRVQHMAADGICQRFQQGGGLAHPLRQRRAVQIQSVTLKYLALPIQRQVIAVFRDEHMRQQAGTGASALDRTGWQWGLYEGFATGTGRAWPRAALRHGLRARPPTPLPGTLPPDHADAQGWGRNAVGNPRALL